MKHIKSIETKHHEERDAFFEGLRRLDRRGFMRLAGLSAGIVAAKGLITPHSFQLVSVADAAPRPAPASPSRTSPTRTCTRRSSTIASCAPSCARWMT
ncbi:hypothetical protein ACN28S_24290 [Cystobacter fuscus]